MIEEAEAAVREGLLVATITAEGVTGKMMMVRPGAQAIRTVEVVVPVVTIIEEEETAIATEIVIASGKENESGRESVNVKENEIEMVLGTHPDQSAEEVAETIAEVGGKVPETTGIVGVVDVIGDGPRTGRISSQRQFARGSFNNLVFTHDPDSTIL